MSGRDIKKGRIINLNHVRIFILPLCDFSVEESHNLSLDELNSLWQQERIAKYPQERFLQDINDDTPVDNANNRIVAREQAGRHPRSERIKNILYNCQKQKTTMNKFITAGFNSSCCQTGAAIKKGDDILYDTHTKEVFCRESGRFSLPVYTKCIYNRITDYT